MSQSKSSDYIQNKINLPTPSQEPPASSKVQNHDLNIMDDLFTLKIKIESQNMEYGWLEDHWSYPNHNQVP